MSSFLIKKVNKIILNLMMTSNNLAKKLQVEPKDNNYRTLRWYTVTPMNGNCNPLAPEVEFCIYSQ